RCAAHQQLSTTAHRRSRSELGEARSVAWDVVLLFFETRWWGFGEAKPSPMGRSLVLLRLLDVNACYHRRRAAHNRGTGRDLHPVETERLAEQVEITQAVSLNNNIAEAKYHRDPFVRLIVSWAGVVRDLEEIAPEERFADWPDPEDNARL